MDKEPVIFALGIKETGEYEVLGFYLTVKESHNSYKEVLEDLYSRGLKEPLLIVADGIKNGKYKRDLKTKYGEIKQLNIPRDRDSNFHTKVIEPYNRSIGIEDLIVSMYSNGISTRRIAGIMEDILGNKYSKSTISRITDLTVL